MKIICLTKNFKVQTPSGGYDQLATYLNAKTISRSAISSLPMRVAEKAWHFGFGDKPHLFSHLSHGYRFEDRLCEERAFWRALRDRADIIHVHYGDWALDMLLRRRRLLPGRLVATFHLPADAVAERFERTQREALQRLDGAVLLSSADLPAFSAWLGPEKVMHIPHGIDTDTFRPADFASRKTARFVFVGMMLRDFETAHRVIDRCREEQLDAEFVIVIGAAGRAYFTGCTNARIVSNISEPELIALYQQSDALFLPLLNSTANNAILEALACGLPVISTQIGGVPDYLDDSCGWLLPPVDVDAAYQCVRDIVRNREIATAKRRAARVKAEGFSWVRIAVTLMTAYARLCKSQTFSVEAALMSMPYSSS
jgi:glycosyltransferase involved in cell wall biosynthesis